MNFLILVGLLIGATNSYAATLEVSKIVNFAMASTSAQEFNLNLKILRDGIRDEKAKKLTTPDSIYLNGLETFLEMIPTMPISKSNCEGTENSMRTDNDPQGRLSEANSPKYFTVVLGLLKKGCSFPL